MWYKTSTNMRFDRFAFNIDIHSVFQISNDLGSVTRNMQMPSKTQNWFLNSKFQNYKSDQMMWKIRLYKLSMTNCFSFPKFSYSRNVSVKILQIQQIIFKLFLFNYLFIFNNNFLHLYVCLSNFIFFLIYFLSVLSFFNTYFFSILSALHYPIVDLKNSGKILKMYEVHGTELHVEQPIIFLSAVRWREWHTDTIKKFWTHQY